MITDNSNWRDELRRVLNKYFDTTEAVDSVIAMYGSIRSVNAVLGGATDDNTRRDVAQMLLDNVYGLDTNPFMMQYRFRIWPVYQMAVNSYIDSLTYFMDDLNEAQKGAGRDDTTMTKNFLKGLGCKHMLHEIALVCLMCEKGGAMLRSNSRAMRDELIEAFG